MGKKSIKSCSAQDPVSFILPAVMTIETIETLAAELKQLPLMEKGRLVLDASKIETITTPGLQLILSMERTLGAHGGSMTIASATGPLKRALAESGLGTLLTASS